MDRRLLLKSLAATGIGSTLFHRTLVAMQETDDAEELTLEQIQQAEWVTEIELDDEERKAILSSVNQTAKSHRKLRTVKLGQSVAPAVHFKPLAKTPVQNVLRRGFEPTEQGTPKLPDSDDAIAFLPVTELAVLIKHRKISSTRLTKIYLERLKKFGGMLRCVVTLTEDLALKQAAKADKEIESGRYRGALHGIPWGAKDLISIPGYPTTWGIPHLKSRESNTTATVAKRLEEAGAVLVAKLSLGALAMGDKWFGGMTRSPWNPRIGSSGSSAGSASAVVAGLVGFTLGTETLGSILSPSRRCGASGLRPTFGRVSRAGCMPLSWSMDKVGPICRSVEDCALVFGEIHGADGQDATTNSYAFEWPRHVQFDGLRVGYTRRSRPIEEREDLKILSELGCKLVEVKLQNDLNINESVLAKIIDVEGASMFDDLLRNDHTEGWNAWPRIFRAAQYISAVDYLRYQRVRSRLMNWFDGFMQNVDVLCNVRDIFITNLTGHPSVVFPRSFRERKGLKIPVSIVLTGHLNQDDRLLALASAYQSRLQAHLEQPPLEDWLVKFNDGTLDSTPEKEEKTSQPKAP